MFLLLPVWCGAMFEFVQSNFEDSDDLPRSSELVGQYVNTFFGCIRSNSMAGKYNIANRVHARIRMTGIDELLTANSNQALRDVCAGYGTRVQRIEKEEDSFQSNADGVTLIGYYLQTFHEVSINTHNHHGVMVITRKNVAVDVQ
jgi:hypothetical protein